MHLCVSFDHLMQKFFWHKSTLGLYICIRQSARFGIVCISFATSITTFKINQKFMHHLSELDSVWVQRAALKCIAASINAISVTYSNVARLYCKKKTKYICAAYWYGRWVFFVVCIAQNLFFLLAFNINDAKHSNSKRAFDYQQLISAISFILNTGPTNALQPQITASNFFYNQNTSSSSNFSISSNNIGVTQFNNR